MRRVMTQAELEAEIDGDFDEHRNELRVEQVSPAYRVPRAAYLPVRADRLADVEAFFDAASERLTNCVRPVDGARLRDGREAAWFAGLPRRPLIQVGHDSDRTYAGYANIYRAIKALAPMLDDCRFYISEDYSTFVDEYRIEGGALWLERGYAADALLARVLELAPDRRAQIEAEPDLASLRSRD